MEKVVPFSFLKNGTITLYCHIPYVKQRILLLPPPLGEELCPDHPLLERRRAHNKNKSLSSTALCRYIVLGKRISSLHLFLTKFAHISAICRCFLNIHSTYMLYPLHNQETSVCICVLQLFVIERTPVVC